MVYYSQTSPLGRTVGTLELEDGAVTAAKHTTTLQKQWELISDTVLGAAAASMSLASIPTGYKLLKLFISAKMVTDGASLELTFNSDTGNNYTYRCTRSYDTTVASINQAATSSMKIGLFHSNFGGGFLFIRNDAANEKTVVFNCGSAGGGDADNYNRSGVGEWINSSDEITTITLTSGTGNIVAGTRLVLMGYR